MAEDRSWALEFGLSNSNGRLLTFETNEKGTISEHFAEACVNKSKYE
jgi:hypothetical protein